MVLPLLWRQLNGERAVVLVYIILILLYTPFTLFPQAISLPILSFFALFVEISADDASNPLSHFFLTRRGASSGILLGAVTLPGLMLSRLIQILRSVSLEQAGIEELEYLKLQYWAASACCFTVLIFLCIICQRQQYGTISKCSLLHWNAKLTITCVTLLLGFVLVSFSGISYDGWPVASTSLWILCHGFAAVKLIQKILHLFPACASVGESLLVTTGLVLYCGDMLAYTVAKITSNFSSSKAVSVLYRINKSEISTIIQGMIVGLLLFPVIYKFVLRMWKYISSLCNNKVPGNQEMKNPYVFYASLTVMLVVIAPSWMQLVHSFQVHPFAWVLQFVFSEALILCAYWLIVISLSVRTFYNISKNSTTERILLRKYYHLMAVVIFVPAILYKPRFLNLAFGAALAAFLLLEMIRIWKIWPLGNIVHQFMNAFTDHRDSDLLIVSHFSLLLGCALPIWLSSGYNDRPFAPFAGILSLGIGDTMASMVGHKYGVLRWSKTCKKTIEGTAAGIAAVLLACFILLPFLADIFTTHWLSLILAVTVSGLLEACTAQLDNAFIPLVFYSLLCL